MRPHTIKNFYKEKQIITRRIIALSTAITIMALALFSRLIYLQVSQHGQLSEKSDNNKYKIEHIIAKRGVIFDRNNIVVAENIPSYSLVIIPKKVTNIQHTLSELSSIISLSQQEQDQIQMEMTKRTNAETILVKTALKESEMTAFYLHKYTMPEIEVRTYLKRYYPQSEAMASVLGYVGKIKSLPDDLEESIVYQINPIRGYLGIEESYESILRGYPGYNKILVDAKGKQYQKVNVKQPESGANIQLTIDSHLQETAYQALGNESGAVVAIDPNNGEILALVTKPSYDPNLFVDGISQHNLEILQNKNNPLFNRATLGQFPLASSIKPFISIHAIEKNIINPQEKIFDSGHYQYANTKNIYHDWNLDGHGYVDMRKALILSCDTYFYQLSVKMGIHSIDEALYRFGFGSKTTPDILSEATGIVASPQWKIANKKEKWYVGDTIISSIGQGFMLTTPLQLASATAILANKGVGYNNHLVRSIHYIDSVVPTDIVVTHNNVISNHAWEYVTQSMVDVITDNEGTGFRFGKDATYEVAAKTGTAQVIKINNIENIPKKFKDHSIFIGFSPRKHPKIVVAVIAENTNIAPVVARKVFDSYYKKDKT